MYEVVYACILMQLLISELKIDLDYRSVSVYVNEDGVLLEQHTKQKIQTITPCCDCHQLFTSHNIVFYWIKN